MVTVIDFPNLRRALSYNEEKLRDGRAALIYARMFHKPVEELSFKEKYERLKRLTDLRETVRRNCLHISLNFDPSENLERDRLTKIADEYMEKIGFDGQPYLVYQHFDAGHPHLHIVTVNIRPDGMRIPTHMLGKTKSEMARRAIEAKYGLIRADGRKQQEFFVLKPANIKAAEYGKGATKNTISNIVNSVIKHYKFTSLSEFNAVLNRFNITADSGAPGSRTFENGGLIYSLLNEGKKMGIPIKASSIFTKPTLARLKKLFIINSQARNPYLPRLRLIIDDTLRSNVDQRDFVRMLATEKIDAVFHTNPEGAAYGVTFIDHKTGVVVKGSDLGKRYGTRGILSRCVSDSHHPEVLENRKLVENLINETDFSRGLKSVLTGWLNKGIMVDARPNEEYSLDYWVGKLRTNRAHFFPAGEKLSQYFLSNRLNDRHTTFIADNIYSIKTVSGLINQTVEPFAFIVEEAFRFIPHDDYIASELLKEATRKRRKKRR